MADCFDPALLQQLLKEFRRSIQGLLADLCAELEHENTRAATRYRLPVTLFRRLGEKLPLVAFSGWKAVGWVESLNDLVYFLDVEQQLAKETDPREFARQLLAECEERLYEHSYLDELFPLRRPDPAGLKRRLAQLCSRLAEEISQEAIFLDPSFSCEWAGTVTGGQWLNTLGLASNFERAEPADTIAVGTNGDYLTMPLSVQQSTRSLARSIELIVRPQGMWVRVPGLKRPLPLCEVKGDRVSWQWQVHQPTVLAKSQSGVFTVGPTLVYGKDREPVRVLPTPAEVGPRIQTTLRLIREAWPLGYQLLALLTSRIVPLKAKGVVSFSYRHRPGLSFINCFDRDDLDLIDDLIHENSHHHLNLLLRKSVLYRGDQNREIFYSPWRRSLRPLRGILHATFTFTMGAVLFERLSAWGASGKGRGARDGKSERLTERELLRARFRCLEEVESVRYSLQDLHYADHHLGWLTGSGRRMVGQLAEAIDQVEGSSERFKREVLRSTFGPALRRHMKELQQARMTYGPVRLSQA